MCTVTVQRTHAPHAMTFYRQFPRLDYARLRPKLRDIAFDSLTPAATYEPPYPEMTTSKSHRFNEIAVHPALVYQSPTPILVVLLLLSVLAALVPFPPAFATESPSHKHTYSILSGHNCKLDLPTSIDWSSAEKWAWSQICKGQVANFNTRAQSAGHAVALDPRNSAHHKYWDDSRKIRSIFLETLLLHEPYRTMLSRKGVRITGAYFASSKYPRDNSWSIDLTDAHLLSPLSLKSCRIDNRVSFRHLKTESYISLSHSNVFALVDLDGADIKGPLFLQSATFADLDMRRARMASTVSLDNTEVTGNGQMSSIIVRSDLYMRDAQYGTMMLRGSRIEGQLNLDGSKFSGSLDMDSVRVGESLHMQNAVFHNEVLLSGGKIGGQMSLNGSKFHGLLDMDSLISQNGLYMQKGQYCKVILRGATIDGQLGITGSQFRKLLNLNHAKITDAVFLKNGHFATVDMRHMQTMGTLDLALSKFSGQVQLDAVSVGGDLQGRGANFTDLRMLGGRVSGQMDLLGAIFSGRLHVEAADIGRDVVARKIQFGDLMAITTSKIGKDLDVRGARLKALNLTQTTISGDLILKSDDHLDEICWSQFTGSDGKIEGPTFILRSAVVGGLLGSENSWPEHLRYELEGFIYSRLGTIDNDDRDSTYGRGRLWFRDWLGRDAVYSPQPYRQLASVLRDVGYNDLSASILYDGRERERGETSIGEAKWWFLSALNLVIGYGYGWRYFIAVLWLIGLVGVGVLVLSFNSCGRNWTLAKRTWYSLDMVIPIIRLREKHYQEVDIRGRARYWFGIQQVMGYVLVFFVIAGLSGLAEING